jgi:hypothetical protein
MYIHTHIYIHACIQTHRQTDRIMEGGERERERERECKESATDAYRNKQGLGSTVASTLGLGFRGEGLRV